MKRRAMSRAPLAVGVVLGIGALLLSGCSSENSSGSGGGSGSDTTSVESNSSSSSSSTAAGGGGSQSSGSESSGTGSATGTDSGSSSCPDVYNKAVEAVKAARNPEEPWTGPTTGPKAQKDKLIVYISETQTNGGPAGVAKGVQEAAKAIGWDVRVIDGQGTTTGFQAAMGQALALNANGIIIGGFDPGVVKSQVQQAEQRNIPIVGWHAAGNPGPDKSLGLFTNITTSVKAVSELSAQWIIAHSHGNAGVVVFTDNSIPFASGKSKLIEKDLKVCSGVTVLKEEDIPLPDATQREPQAFSSLLSTLGDKWNYSVAINDLYFDNAATPLRAAGKKGDGAPYNVGAGDGSKAAFSRVASGQYQAATIPEPLNLQGWQAVDELNRAMAGEKATGWYAKPHVTDSTNVDHSTAWDPDNGYRDIYKKIWGVS